MLKVQNLKLCRAIEQLPEVQKRRTRMYCLEGMTYEEIAVEEKCTNPEMLKFV